MKTAVRVLLVTLALQVAGLALGAAKQKRPFTLTLTAPKRSLKAGAKLVLCNRLKNTSHHDITFGTSPGLIPPDTPWYKVEVLDAQGCPAPPSAWTLALRRRRAILGGSVLSRTLKPGQSLVDEIDVTRYYDLSRPGAYTIWVVRPLPVGVPARAPKKYWKGSVRSNTITVTVIK